VFNGTCTSLTEFVVYLCIYLPDDDLVEVETCRRDISDKWLFIIDCAVCWFKYCIINLLHGIWIMYKLSLEYTVMCFSTARPQCVKGLALLILI
jgi:hypothetical protein